jgi:hypothetical protein
MSTGDLRRRLSRLRLDGRPRHRASPGSQDRAAGTGSEPVTRVPRPIEELVAGEVLDTAHGSCFLFRERYPLDYLHGQRPLSALAAHAPAGPALLARDERLAGVALERIVFVDTETTGLAGGTGTYAFLVGAGLFRDGRFELHQFFMRDYGEEAAQLDALSALLDGAEAVVSFNGKSFDLPLLESRFIMNRRPLRLRGAPHLDLLPVARRLWKYRLESCALSSLETEILGVRRSGADVPGWLIPGLYADYVRSGDAREMPRIFYHNAQDILSLVTLSALLCEMVVAAEPEGQDPASLSGEHAGADPSGQALPGEDLYGLGRIFLDLGDAARAEAAYLGAAERCQRETVRERAIRDLAALLKRQERRLEALPWWEELARSRGAVDACEDLAKHYEWHEGDLARAVTWTEEGLALASAWPRGSRRRQVVADLEHRLARLHRKQDGT